MLNYQEAEQIINDNIPGAKIQKVIDYHGLYIFMVFTDDPFEGEMDPFYSVNQQTGEFAEFSILTDGDPVELMDLFTKAKPA